MLAAHCDTKQQKSLQPILKQDLRMLGVYNVPYFYHAGPDYGRAQFKVSWEITVGSVGHLSLTLHANADRPLFERRPTMPDS